MKNFIFKIIVVLIILFGINGCGDTNIISPNITNPNETDAPLKTNNLGNTGYVYLISEGKQFNYSNIYSVEYFGSTHTLFLITKNTEIPYSIYNIDFIFIYPPNTFLNVRLIDIYQGSNDWLALSVTYDKNSTSFSIEKNPPQSFTIEIIDYLRVTFQ